MNPISVSFNCRCVNRVEIYSKDHLTYPRGMAWHTLTMCGFNIYCSLKSMNEFTIVQRTHSENTSVLGNFNRDMFCFLHKQHCIHCKLKTYLKTLVFFFVIYTPVPYTGGQAHTEEYLSVAWNTLDEAEMPPPTPCSKLG